MGKAALVVGINYYEHQSNLHGCVNDARTIDTLLAEHENEDQNFETRFLDIIYGRCLIFLKRHYAHRFWYCFIIVQELAML